MTTRQWQQLGLFAGLAATVAFIDVPVAQKLVLAVGGLVLIVGAPRIAGAINSTFGG